MLTDQHTHDPILDAEAAGEVRYRLGKLGLVSVNTWLIVINIAVFFAGYTALGGRPVTISWGEFWITSTTPEQRARAVTLTSVHKPMPPSPGLFAPGVFYHPKIDPESVIRTADGRVVYNLLTGKPESVEVGGVRFTQRPLLDAVGHFSTGKALTDLQVWRFITFQFLHANWVHLAFNMLGLWFIGGLVEQYLGRRRYLVFYLLCGAAGAMMYLILNLLGYLVFTHVSPALLGRVPALLFEDIYTPLVGASAGVFGVLLAAARIAPRQIVDVAFILPMRLATAVYIFLALAIVNLLTGGSNAGGDAAHVGGAIAGAYLVRNPHILRSFVRMLPQRRNAPLPPVAMDENQRLAAEIDRILDKVDHEGTHSLTPAERDFLHRARDLIAATGRR